MATEYKGLTITFNADTRKFNSALREARSGARGITTELKLLEKGLKIDPTNTDLLARKQDVYRQKIQATRKELEAYKTLEAQASKQNNGAGLTSEQWTKLKSDIAITTQRLKEYERALEQMAIDQQVANSSLNKAGVTLTTVGTKLEGASAKAGALGTALTNTVTKGMAIAGGASVVAATKIDTSLTNVKKTVDGTAEDYQKLKEAAIEFSQTNAVSASQILDIESLGAQLGYTLDIMSNGKSEVQEFGEVVSGLDIATNMDAETAGTELAQFFNIMQIGKEQTENYAAAIVDLGNKNATTESAISAMALRIAGAGKQIGLTGADVLGLATALTSLGVEAEMGGTAISTIMSQIDKSVALNNDTLQTWAETAQMSVNDFANAWKTKPTEALNAVLQGMNSAVESGGNMAVMLDDLGISSLRQTDVMKRLAGGGETLAKAINISNTAWQENTALLNEVANRNDSLSAKFEMLKNQVIAVAEQIGKPLADALLGAIDAGKPLFDAIASGAKAFSEMSKEEQQTVLTTAGVIATAGPLLKVMGNTSDVCKKLGSTLSKMSNYFATLNVEALKNSEAIADNAKGQKALGTAVATSETSVKKATLSQKAYTLATRTATTASKLLKGAIAGIAGAVVIASITTLVSGIQKMVEAQQKATERTNNLKNSTDNLKSSVDNSTSSIKGQASTVNDTKKSFSDLRDEIDDVIKKQSDFTNSQKETWGNLNYQTGYVSDLVSQIEQLCDKEYLTTSQQAELSSKVEEYNNLTGNTISIIDITKGKLSESIDKIKENTEAWRRNAEAQALQERYKEIFNNKIEAQNKLTEAIQKQADALRILDDWNSKGQFDPITASQLEQQVQDANKAVEEAQKVVDNYGEALEETAQQQSNLSREAFKSTEDFKKLASELNMTSDQLNALCDKYKITGEEGVKNFVNALKSGIPEVQAAAIVVSGKSVEEFQNDLNTYKIAGDQSVNAFSQAILNGASVAIAGASTVTGLTVEEFERRAQELEGVGTEAINKFASGMQNEMSVAEIQQAGAFMANTNIKEFEDLCNKFGIVGEQDIRNFVSGMNSQSSASIQASAYVAGLSVAEFQNLLAQYRVTGEDDIVTFANAIRNNGGNAQAAAREVADKSVQATQKREETQQSGKNFAQGFADGISSMWGTVCGIASNLANAAANTVKNALGIHSPSKVTKEFGRYFSEGFAIGIEDKARLGQKNAVKMAEDTLKAFNSIVSRRNALMTLDAVTKISYGNLKPQVTNNTIRIDGLKVNDDEEMARVTRAFVDTMIRKAGM